MKQTVLMLASLLAAVCLLVGCSGGDRNLAPAAGNAGLAFTIQWPEPTRLIPVKAKTIVITVSGENLPEALSKTTTRPLEGPWTTSLTFLGLTPGTYTVVAEAFPEILLGAVRQTSVVPLAHGSMPVTLAYGQILNQTLTMHSTITELRINPDPVAVTVSGTTTLTATAYNAQEQLVLIEPTLLQWTVDNSSVATWETQADGSVVVTGVAEGSTTVRATEGESGKSAAAAVTVAAGTPTGPFVPMTPGDTYTYTKETFNYDTSGILIGSTDTTSTITVEALTTLSNGIPAYPFSDLWAEESTYLLGDTTTLYSAGSLQNTVDGLMESLYTPPVPWIKTTEPAGATWTYTGTLSESYGLATPTTYTVTYEFKILSIGSYTTQSATYPYVIEVEVRMSDPSGEITEPMAIYHDWYAWGVGLIREEIYTYNFMNPGTYLHKSTNELTAYTPWVTDL
jgi:hypothetical protein